MVSSLGTERPDYGRRNAIEHRREDLQLLAIVPLCKRLVASQLQQDVLFVPYVPESPSEHHLYQNETEAVGV